MKIIKSLQNDVQNNSPKAQCIFENWFWLVKEGNIFELWGTCSIIKIIKTKKLFLPWILLGSTCRPENDSVRGSSSESIQTCIMVTNGQRHRTGSYWGDKCSTVCLWAKMKRLVRGDSLQIRRVGSWSKQGCCINDELDEVLTWPRNHHERKQEIRCTGHSVWAL